MCLRRIFIHILGGYTKDEYNDMSRIAADAMKNWKDTIDVDNRAIEVYKQSNERYKQAYNSASKKYIKILEFISATFGDKNKSKDDILEACKQMLLEIDDEN